MEDTMKNRFFNAWRIKLTIVRAFSMAGLGAQ
jgi:hypothetical protein